MTSSGGSKSFNKKTTFIGASLLANLCLDSACAFSGLVTMKRNIRPCSLLVKLLVAPAETKKDSSCATPSEQHQLSNKKACLEHVAEKLNAQAIEIERSNIDVEKRERKAVEVFDRLDQDHNGKLSADELKLGFVATLKEESPLSDEDIEELLANFDDRFLELSAQIQFLTGFDSS